MTFNIPPTEVHRASFEDALELPDPEFLVWLHHREGVTSSERLESPIIPPTSTPNNTREASTRPGPSHAQSRGVQLFSATQNDPNNCEREARDAFDRWHKHRKFWIYMPSLPHAHSDQVAFENLSPSDVLDLTRRLKSGKSRQGSPLTRRLSEEAPLTGRLSEQELPLRLQPPAEYMEALEAAERIPNGLKRALWVRRVKTQSRNPIRFSSWERRVLKRWESSAKQFLGIEAALRDGNTEKAWKLSRKKNNMIDNEYYRSTGSENWLEPLWRYAGGHLPTGSM